MVRSGATLAFVVSVLSCNPLAAQEVVTIHLRYNEIHDRILPFQQQTTTVVDVEAHVMKTGVVQDETRSSGGRSRHTQLHTDSQQLTLGASSDRQRWHVAGPNRLLNVADYESYRRAILVTVAGQECSAQVDYKLKPGFTDYRYHRLTTGEPAVATAVRADDLVCTVQ